MFRQKVSIIEKLKESGYSTYRIFKEKIFGSATMTKFRNGGIPSWNELDKICNLCNCKPWDIIEYIPGNQNESIRKDKGPNA